MAAIPLAFSDKNKTYVFDGAKLEEQKRLERQGEGESDVTLSCSHVLPVTLTFNKYPIAHGRERLKEYC
jgi:hypothetical protein